MAPKYRIREVVVKNDVKIALLPLQMQIGHIQRGHLKNLAYSYYASCTRLIIVLSHCLIRAECWVYIDGKVTPRYSGYVEVSE